MDTARKILLAIPVILIAVPVGLLIVSGQISSQTAIGFLGVIVGGAITGFVQYGISVANREQQFRLAALDKRLQAHQEAYTLWRRLLFTNKQSREIYDVVDQCQEWWEQNCLYLSSEARSAFLRAYLAAPDWAAALAAHQDAQEVEKAGEDVRRAGPAIVRGVSLPTIGEAETKHIPSDRGQKRSAGG